MASCKRRTCLARAAVKLLSQAIEIYQQAANQYKMAKMWQEAIM